MKLPESPRFEVTYLVRTGLAKGSYIVRNEWRQPTYLVGHYEQIEYAPGRFGTEYLVVANWRALP